VEFLLEVLRGYGQWRLPLFGLILLLTMRFARNGLLTPLWLQLVRLGETRADVATAARDVPQKEPGL
jgi:hypothetical protein